MHTIIGAKSFHCPVRDGKEWDQLAMVVRHNWRLAECSYERSAGHYLEEVKQVLIVASATNLLQLNVIGSSLTGN
jgi:hypothetical protein